MWDYLYIGTQFVLLRWQVVQLDLAHIQGLATNYNYLTSASASPQSHIIRICVNSQMWVTTTTCDAVYPMFNAHQLKYNDIIGKSDRKCCEALHMKVLVNLLEWDTLRDHVVKTLWQVSTNGHTVPLTEGDVESTFQGVTSQTKYWTTGICIHITVTCYNKI